MMKNRETILFYNVENFYLPFTKETKSLEKKSGLRNWTMERYREKINKINQVINWVAESQTFPMFIGFSEVQDRKVLEDLISNNPNLEASYKIIQYDSLDERGVDCACIFDENKLKLISSEPISFIFENEDNNLEFYDTTRDVLHSKFLFKETKLNIFICHLPSKRENDINAPKRQYVLENVKNKINDIINNFNESVILMGDFNDNPQEIDKIITNNTNNKKNILFNPFANLYDNGIYSTYYHNEGLLFDQMIFSENFLSNNSDLKFLESGVFQSPKMSTQNIKGPRKPLRTYSGSRYLGGFSDHYPVYTTFET